MSVAAVTAALVGCSSIAGTSVNTSPAISPAKPSVPHHAAAKPAAAHVGSTINIKGEQAGDVMAVTLVKVAATTTATDQFSTPQAGNRYCAVQFRLASHGRNAYDDAPSNGAVVVDSQGQQFNATIVVSIAAGPLLPAEVKIPPGGTALGWIVFEVPKTARITAVQFALSSGFGNAGQWRIP